MAKFAASDSASRDSFGVEFPGTYHLFVRNIEEYPKNKKGELIKGWRVNCTVVAGTDQRAIGKEPEIIFSHPNANSSDGGDFARRKQTRFLLATGFMTEEQLGKEIDVELERQGTGRQFIAKFVERSYTAKDGNVKQSVDVDGLDFWHVDDVEARDYPKDENMLKQLPESLRLKKDEQQKVKTEPAKQPTTVQTEKPNSEYSESADSAAVESLYDTL